MPDFTVTCARESGREAFAMRGHHPRRRRRVRALRQLHQLRDPRARGPRLLRQGRRRRLRRRGTPQAGRAPALHDDRAEGSPTAIPARSGSCCSSRRSGSSAARRAIARCRVPRSASRTGSGASRTPPARRWCWPVTDAGADVRRSDDGDVLGSGRGRRAADPALHRVRRLPVLPAAVLPRVPGRRSRMGARRGHAGRSMR